jgi:hypothetical protein
MESVMRDFTGAQRAKDSSARTVPEKLCGFLLSRDALHIEEFLQAGIRAHAFGSGSGENKQANQIIIVLSRIYAHSPSYTDKAAIGILFAKHGSQCGSLVPKRAGF